MTEKDQGFSLIELLVVIIGILDTTAILALLTQQKKRRQRLPQV